MRVFRLFISAAIVLCTSAAFTDKTSTPERIHQILAKGVITSEPLHETENLRQFYEKKSEGMSWTLDNAVQMLQAIDRAQLRGLNSNHYHKNAIQLLMNSSTETSISFELDVLLSDSFLHLAKHLHSGKTRPPRTWKMKRFELNTVDLLSGGLHSSEILKTLYSVEPPSIQYEMIIEALHYYQTIADNGGWAPMQGDRKLSSGSFGDDVESLSNRLKLTDGFSESKDSKLFDDPLDAAVRRFQARHGLNVDGIVGRSTREALDISVEKRINQLKLNLERFRWISENLGPHYITINIPAYQLTVVQNGHKLLPMRIIAGKSDWASPIFLSSEITYVETNPFWNVPDVIATKEIWPKVLKDPNYLKKNQLKMIKRTDGSLMFRQQPGPHNSLGLIKIHFDNDSGCYMHDTPEKGLFSRSDRAFSHGCIRLENAFDLAAYLLASDPNWDEEKLKEAARTGSRNRIYLVDPIPIYILYLTAWPDNSGTIHFRKDVYGADAALKSVMSN